MEQPTLEMARTESGETLITFREPLDFAHAHAHWDGMVRLLSKQRPEGIILDFSGLPAIDSAGIALLRLVWRRCRQQQVPLQLRSVPPSAEYFLRYLETEPAPVRKEEGLGFSSVVSGVGRLALSAIREYRELLHFLGDFLLSSSKSLRHFRRFRWREMIYYAQLAGAEAMPIVFLLSFLLGLVMAFQAAVQLRQFGANIFVADLLSLALTRELGPVFTAVILAGRSGSAIAAELGAMKVNEEVDALAVMGFDITQFLILPRVCALALVGPLLTFLADASGIAGGIVVGVLGLDLTVGSFLEETYQILTLSDILTGLSKSFVFAILVALIGCFRGLQAEKGADSVGRQTTSAVVSGLFLIILADSVFTVIFHVFDL